MRFSAIPWACRDSARSIDSIAANGEVCIYMPPKGSFDVCYRPHGGSLIDVAAIDRERNMLAIRQDISPMTDILSQLAEYMELATVPVSVVDVAERMPAHLREAAYWIDPQRSRQMAMGKLSKATSLAQSMLPASFSIKLADASPPELVLDIHGPKYTSQIFVNVVRDEAQVCRPGMSAEHFAAVRKAFLAVYKPYDENSKAYKEPAFHHIYSTMTKILLL